MEFFFSEATVSLPGPALPGPRCMLGQRTRRVSARAFSFGRRSVMLRKLRNDRLRRTLLVERLEERTVLSGNVVALQDPTGFLSVVGDNGDNAIAITQDSGGADIITGETATSVNNGPAASFSNVT